jgi:hypothetical protein
LFVSSSYADQQERNNEQPTWPSTLHVPNIMHSGFECKRLVTSVIALTSIIIEPLPAA